GEDAPHSSAIEGGAPSRSDSAARRQRLARRRRHSCAVSRSARGPTSPRRGEPSGSHAHRYRSFPSLLTCTESLYVLFQLRASQRNELHRLELPPDHLPVHALQQPQVLVF